MNRCVIVGGAGIGDYDRIRKSLRPEDYLIFCDCGLRHREPLKVRPDLIVGDFDSCENPRLPAETIALPCEKDDTDTVFAVKEAIRRGYEDFLLIGMTGQRFDHTIGNVSILFFLDQIGKKGLLLDDYGEMEVVSGQTAFVEDTFSYFSLLNLTGTAGGVTIQNAKYPLDRARITCEYQYGISNEVLPGKTAKITVEEGKLLLVKIL